MSSFNDSHPDVDFKNPNIQVPINDPIQEPKSSQEGVEPEAFQPSTYAALEKDFQEVLQELSGDKALEHFKDEYEKIHRALTKSHESEKKLVKKCRELNSDIVGQTQKVII